MPPLALTFQSVVIGKHNDDMRLLTGYAGNVFMFCSVFQFLTSGGIIPVCGSRDLAAQTFRSAWNHVVVLLVPLASSG